MVEERKLRVKDVAEELGMDPREFFYYAAQCGVRFYEGTFPRDHGIDFGDFIARKKSEFEPASQPPWESIVRTIEANLTENMQRFAQYVSGKIEVQVANAEVTLSDGKKEEIKKRKEIIEPLEDLMLRAHKASKNILESNDFRYGYALAIHLRDPKNKFEQGQQTIGPRLSGLFSPDQEKRLCEIVLDPVYSRDLGIFNALAEGVIKTAASKKQAEEAQGKNKTRVEEQGSLDVLIEIYAKEFKDLYAKHKEGFSRLHFPVIATSVARCIAEDPRANIPFVPRMMLEVYDAMLEDPKFSPYCASGETYRRMGTIVQSLRDKETVLVCHAFLKEMEEEGYLHVQLEESTELPFRNFCNLDEELARIVYGLQDASMVRDVLTFWRETVDYYKQHPFNKGFIAEIDTLEFIAGQSRSSAVTRMGMEFIQQVRCELEFDRYATLSNVVMGLATMDHEHVSKDFDLLLKAKTPQERYLVAAYVGDVAKAKDYGVPVGELVDMYHDKLPQLPDVYRSPEFTEILIVTLGKICTTTETEVAHQLLAFFDDPNWTTHVEATKEMVWTVGDIANRIGYSEEMHYGIRLNTQAMYAILDLLEPYAFDPKTACAIVCGLELIQRWESFRGEKPHRFYRLMEIYCAEETHTETSCGDLKRFIARHQNEPIYWPLAAEIVTKIGYYSKKPETLERCLELLSEDAEKRSPHLPRALLLEVHSLAKNDDAKDKIPDLVDVLYAHVFSDRIEQQRKEDKNYLRKVREEKTQTVKPSLDRVQGCDTLAAEEMAVVEDLYQTEIPSVVTRAVQALNIRRTVEQEKYDGKPDLEEVRECATLNIPDYVVIKKLKKADETGEEQTIEGGTRKIYVAQHQDGRLTILKVARTEGHVPKPGYSPQQIDPEQMREAGRKESEIISHLGTHPNIVVLYERSNLPDGRPYSVEEYIKGESVRDFIKDEKRWAQMTYSGKIDIIRKILTGLSHVHGRNIVHGDLASGNSMINQQGEVKLIDFGSATIVGSDGFTSAENVMLTPRFYAPAEYYEGRYGLPSDAYQTGILMFEILTGRFPFERRKEEMKDVVKEREFYEEMRRNIEAHIPPELQPVLKKATQMDSEQRYKNAGELKQAFEEAITDKNRNAIIKQLDCGQPLKEENRAFLLAYLKRDEQGRT